MSFLNADVPHWYALLRAEYLHDLKSHHGEFEPVAIFGLASIPSRALMFHAMTERGACIFRLPLSAFVHKTDAPDIPLDHLELWDCFSDQPSVHAFAYLRGLRARVFLKDRSLHWGTYQFTVDWTGSPYADDPGEGGSKCAHIIALDNGCYAAQPNNRIYWSEPSFITKPFKDDERPDYVTNSHVWAVEREGKWHAEDSNRVFYDVAGEAQAPASTTISRGTLERAR
jgi:hypothetical protein